MGEPASNMTGITTQVNFQVGAAQAQAQKKKKKKQQKKKKKKKKKHKKQKKHRYADEEEKRKKARAVRAKKLEEERLKELAEPASNMTGITTQVNFQVGAAQAQVGAEAQQE